MPNDTEFAALKARLKATWMAGDYSVFAIYLHPGALQILQAMQIAPGSHMLDVGCGAGQIAIPAARAGVVVTGIDIAANLIQVARARAAFEGLPVRFDEGDAEQLPYPDASFDEVVSLIGAMFAPRPERVAAELLRVCRSGGRIHMANWTPTGFVGQMFNTIARHVPPPPDIPPAVLWGDEDTVRQRFGDGVTDLRMTRQTYPHFSFPFGVPEVVEFFRRFYGPTNRAFAALTPQAQDALRHDLELLWTAHNRTGNNRTTNSGTHDDDDRTTDKITTIEPEYLQISATRR